MRRSPSHHLTDDFIREMDEDRRWHEEKEARDAFLHDRRDDDEWLFANPATAGDASEEPPLSPEARAQKLQYAKYERRAWGALLVAYVGVVAAGMTINLRR